MKKEFNKYAEKPVRFDQYIADKDSLIHDIMDEYGERLIRLSYTYVKNWEDAEDIVQEVFTTCYEKIETFRGEGPLKSWLYTITVNRCKDHLKSWFHRNIWTGIVFESFIPSPEKSPELKLIVDDEYRVLAEELLKLPVKYREILILHYQESMSVQEISELINMKSSTVKSRLHRGRQQLKKAISRQEERGIMGGR